MVLFNSAQQGIVEQLEKRHLRLLKCKNKSCDPQGYPCLNYLSDILNNANVQYVAKSAQVPVQSSSQIPQNGLRIFDQRYDMYHKKSSLSQSCSALVKISTIALFNAILLLLLMMVSIICIAHLPAHSGADHDGASRSKTTAQGTFLSLDEDEFHLLLGHSDDECAYSHGEFALRRTATLSRHSIVTY